MDKGYYNSPNVNIPLNNRPPGELAPVAFDQLKPFQDAAKDWPMREVYRKNRHGMACSYCDQMLFFLADPTGILYDYSYDEIQSLIVAHIRRSHERIVTHGTV